MIPLMSVTELRTALWHFRNEGSDGLRKWWRRVNGQGPAPSATAKSGIKAFGRRRSKMRIQFENAQPSRSVVRFNGIKAAVILDEFSAMAFGFEWDSVAVPSKGWERVLAEEMPDILFVESAWAGNEGIWKFKLTGSAGPSEELRSVVAWCRTRGIPTIFWNKEDPPHYQDFLEAARLFDVVFTSDITRVPDYERDLGHDRIYVLPFAAQPAIHNPIRPQRGWHERDVAFAGMYFGHKYPERREQLDYLLSGAIAASKYMSYGLEIFSRMLGKDDRYQFPASFSKYVVGQLPYGQMLTAYKAYKIFLNANSVVDSPSMCARRIFEITASGTPVVTAPSAAVRAFFPQDEIYVASDAAETRDTLRALVRSSAVGERSVHLAQRRIWREHTYSHRVAAILRSVGRDAEISTLDVSCLVSTHRPQQLRHIFAQFSKQTFREKELVILTHGFQPDSKTIDSLTREYSVENVRAIDAPSSISLGACLNMLVNVSDGEVLSKMDDDDLYGPHYLEDLLHALSFSGADIVGKGAHYMNLQRARVLLRRYKDNEHRFVNHVMGPTITGNRHIFEATPFADLARGEDTDFLTRAASNGAGIYASDRFNFVQVRGSHEHTWRLTDMEAMALGEVEVHGEFDEHVFL